MVETDVRRLEGAYLGFRGSSRGFPELGWTAMLGWIAFARVMVDDRSERRVV